MPVLPVTVEILSTGPLAIKILSIPPFDSLQSSVKPAVKFEQAIVFLFYFIGQRPFEIMVNR
jgi:hypothetical protein